MQVPSDIIRKGQVHNGLIKCGSREHYYFKAEDFATSKHKS